MPEAQKEYDVRPGLGRGVKCLLCPLPVKKGEACIRLQTEIAVNLIVKTHKHHVDEDIHLGCTASFHRDIGAALEQARKLLGSSR